MQERKPITKEDVQEWVDSVVKSGKDSYPPFEKTGHMGGGWYYLGRGFWGGKGAWEAYQKAWKEKVEELSKKYKP